MPLTKHFKKVEFSKHDIFVVTHDAFKPRYVIQLIGHFVYYMGASLSM